MLKFKLDKSKLKLEIHQIFVGVLPYSFKKLHKAHKLHLSDFATCYSGKKIWTLLSLLHHEMSIHTFRFLTTIYLREVSNANISMRASPTPFTTLSSHSHIVRVEGIRQYR